MGLSAEAWGAIGWMLAGVAAILTLFRGPLLKLLALITALLVALALWIWRQAPWVRFAWIAGIAVLVVTGALALTGNLGPLIAKLPAITGPPAPTPTPTAAASPARPVRKGPALTVDAACGKNRASTGVSPSAAGGWSGRMKWAKGWQRLDLYPDGEVRLTGGYRGRWTQASATVEVIFDGGTRYDARIAGRVLCGVRYEGSKATHIFSIKRAPGGLPPRQSATPTPAADALTLDPLPPERDI
jgi:hypothetical protein